MAEEFDGEQPTAQDQEFYRDTMRRHRASQKIRGREIVFEPSVELAAKLASHSRKIP